MEFWYRLRHWWRVRNWDGSIPPSGGVLETPRSTTYDGISRSATPEWRSHSVTIVIPNWLLRLPIECRGTYESMVLSKLARQFERSRAIVGDALDRSIAGER